MNTTKEQLPDVLNRITRIRKERSLRNHCIAEGTAALVCLALIIVSHIYLPLVMRNIETGASAAYGSLILNSSYMGYVTIGSFAFAMGIFITLMCFHLREMKKIRQTAGN